jgi:hypothetical protein
MYDKIVKLICAYPKRADIFDKVSYTSSYESLQSRSATQPAYIPPGPLGMVMSPTSIIAGSEISVP